VSIPAKRTVVTVAALARRGTRQKPLLAASGLSVASQDRPRPSRRSLAAYANGGSAERSSPWRMTVHQRRARVMAL
jgi:hypothetical protein